MNSPFFDLLDTNYCPSDDDTTKIRAMVETNIRTANAVDEDITRELSCISSSIKRRDALLDFAKRHTSLLGATRRVPDDILSTIFHEYLRTEVGAPMTRTHPAVVVSHVCQRWRQLAVSAQSLWNGINLYIPQVSTDYSLRANPTPRPNKVVIQESFVRWKAMVDRILATAQVWLDRSGEYPLDVSLGVAFPDRLLDPPDMGVLQTTRRCLQFLCNLAHRWRSAQFDVGFEQDTRNCACRWRFAQFDARNRAHFLEPLYSLQACHVPQLEFLSLTTAEVGVGRDQSSNVPIDSVLQGAALRTLHLPTVRQGWATLPVNWSTLKELCFSPYHGTTGLPPDEAAWFIDSRAVLLLKACHSLVSCDLTITSDCRSRREARRITSVASLPDLQSLTIRGHTPSINFFQALSLPSLHTLHLTSPTPFRVENPTPNPHFAESPLSPNPVTEWIGSVGHQLHTVSLTIDDVGDLDGLQSLLRNLPSVSELKLSGSRSYLIASHGSGLELARLFTLDNQSTQVDIQTDTHGEPTVSVCPQLRKLHLDMSMRPNALTEEGAVEMVASRRKAPLGRQKPGGVSRLEGVTVEFGMFPTMDIREELERRGVDMTYFRFKASYPDPLPIVPHARPVPIVNLF